MQRCRDSYTCSIVLFTLMHSLFQSVLYGTAMTQAKPVGFTLVRNNSFVQNNAQNGSFTSLQPETDFNQHYHLARMIETYAVPMTCIIGFVGNSLAVKTFLHKSLRHFSCSIYLIVKCVSDTLFLLNLFGIYTSGIFQYNLNMVRNLCHIVIFITYVSGFLSVWTVLLVTTETFIRVRHPFEVKRICTARNAKISIFGLVLTALGIYNVSIWICDKHCSPVSEYSKVTQAFIYVDTLLTLIVPSVLLTIFIIAIVTRMIQTQVRANATNRLMNSNRSRKTSSKIAIVTKMLLSVSLSFFLLTVTSHIVRIKFLISAFLSGKMELSTTEAAIQTLAQIFYYLSMAVNLFIFVLFGDNFRKVFKITIMRSTSVILNVSDTDKDKRSLTQRGNDNVAVNGREASALVGEQATYL